MTPTNTNSVEATAPILRQSEYGAPYINNWLVLGAFENDSQNAGYERDWINESEVAPQAGLVTDGKTWLYFDDRLFSRNYDDYQDLFSYFQVKQNESAAARVVYAHSYIYSSKPQTVQLRVGADTSFKAWVNGELVVANTNSTPVSVIFEPERAHLNSGRDYVVASASLRSGWNRLLLKIANREAGRFGFYARLTQTDGTAVPDLTYSTGGGKGDLAIATSAMPEIKSGLLPTAYSEWSYVGAKVDIERLTALGTSTSGPNGQRPALFPDIGTGFNFNKGLGVQASSFVLCAQGGKAPYSWSLVGGKLPSGLTLSADGTLQGTPVKSARPGSYSFTAQVRDADGKTNRSAMNLNLRQRPNRWMEEARMTALIHHPEGIDNNDVPRLAQLMKRQGYGVAFPISYNNGDFLFRWPATLGKKRTAEDWDAIYKTALEKEGVKFGMYMGNLNNRETPDFKVNQAILVVDEAIRRYHPKAFWFDWLGLDGTSLDSLFSVIRSYDPEAIIVLNGAMRASNGDWDVISFEGWNAWGEGNGAWNQWPVDFPWPKKYTAESWRLAVQSAWSPSRGTNSDWGEMLRIQLSLIGEGFIADMDHSSDLSTAPKAKFEDLPLIKMHSQMAEWANPAGRPSLTEAYTNVNAGPLDEATWGYNTINLKRDTIYLLALKNPRGKTGLPTNGTMDIGVVKGKIKSVTLMNSGSKLPFVQNAKNGITTINIQGITPDSVASIIKIELLKPLTEQQLYKPQKTVSWISKQVESPNGNLAIFKPAWLMSADGTRELGASGYRQFAVLGNDGDFETGAQAAEEWAWSYKVDLQAEYQIRRIVVHFHPKMWATQFQILTSSDGKEWKVVVPVSEGKPGENAYSIAGTIARFVRVQSLKPDGPDQPGGQMSVVELQVFEN